MGGIEKSVVTWLLTHLSKNAEIAIEDVMAVIASLEKVKALEPGQSVTLPSIGTDVEGVRYEEAITVSRPAA